MQLLQYFCQQRPRTSQPAAFCLCARHAFPLAAVPLLFVLCGCGGVSQSSSSPATFSISGTITPQSVGNGTTLNLSGPASAFTTGDSSGSYSFSGLTNGIYVVTPSRSGYSFDPTSQTVVLNGANATGVNFTASQQSVVLSWHASTSVVAGYNVYRGTIDGGPYQRINSTLIASLSYTDSSVQSASTYYYVSTAVDPSGVESKYSNQATAVIP